MRAAGWTGQAAALAAAVLLPASLLAQGDVTGYAGVEARGVSYQTGIGIKSVSEVAIPFAVVWPASTRLSFDLGGRYATASRTSTGDTTVTISGLTDIQVRGTYQLIPDVAAFTVSANLPTGKTQITSDQLLTLGAIASDFLPYPVTTFGSGFNVTSGLALATPVAGWALGVAGSYRLNGTFTPFADTSLGYKAGGEFRVRLGADRVVGQGRLSFGFTYSTFGDDEYGNSRVFQSGTRYIGQGSWSFPVGNVGLQLYAWDLYRSPGSQLQLTTSVSTQKRNLLAFGAAGSVQMGRNVLRPQVEYRIFTMGDSTLASAGRLLSIGAQYQLAVSERFSLLPTLRFDAGSEYGIDANGNPTSQSASLTGWSAALMLRATM